MEMDWTKVSDYLSSAARYASERVPEAKSVEVALKCSLESDIYMTLAVALMKGIDPR